MGVYNYKSLLAHVGHKIECVEYGDVNVVLECIDCGTVLLSYDIDDEDEDEEV